MGDGDVVPPHANIHGSHTQSIIPTLETSSFIDCETIKVCFVNLPPCNWSIAQQASRAASGPNLLWTTPSEKSQRYLQAKQECLKRRDAATWSRFCQNGWWESTAFKHQVIRTHSFSHGMNSDSSAQLNKGGKLYAGRSSKNKGKCRSLPVGPFTLGMTPCQPAQATYLEGQKGSNLSCQTCQTYELH